MGPGAADQSLQVLSGFMFETFSSIYNRTIDLFSNDAAEKSSNLELTSTNLQQTKEYIKNLEVESTDLRKERNQLNEELEKIKAELHTQIRVKDNEIENLFEKITRLEESNEKSNLISQSVGNDLKESQENLIESNEKIIRLQKDIDYLNKKNEESERLLIEYSKTLQLTTQAGKDGDVDANVAASSALYQTIKHLSSQVEGLQNSIKSRNTEKIARLTNRLANKDKEIQNLLNNQQNSLTTLRTTYTAKINSLKELYESRIKTLNENFDNLQATLKQTKTQLFETQKNYQKCQKIQLLNQELQLRIKTLESSIQAKDTKSEINQETFTKFIKQIETIKLEKSSFEEKLMKWKEQGLKMTHEINNVINCVNNIAKGTNDKNLVTHLVKKLDKDTIKNLRPFFGAYKIKV